MAHIFPIRVYYEDTDLAASSITPTTCGSSNGGARNGSGRWASIRGGYGPNKGIVFAVRRIEADYLRPAKFDDELAVLTRLVAATGARILLEQEVMRAGERLFAAQVTLVCLTDAGQPARIPPDVRQRLSPPVH